MPLKGKALDNIDRNQMSHRFVSGVLQNDWLRNPSTSAHLIDQGHPTSIFGKYLFGRRFDTDLPASPRIFGHLKNNNCPFLTDFYKDFFFKRSPRILRSLFFWLKLFRKGKSSYRDQNDYSFWISRLSATKSEQIKKILGDKNMPISTV